MEIVLILVASLIFFISIIVKRYRRSPLMIFSTLWFIVILLYSFRAYQLYDSSDFTFILYLLGIVFCFIGFTIIPPILKPNFTYKRKDAHIKLKITILKILSVLSIGILLDRSIKAIPLWIIGGGDLVRQQLFGGNALEGSIITNILYTYVALPMQTVVMIYVVIAAFSKQSNKLLIISSFVITFLAFICTASKFILAQLFFLFSGYILMISRIKWSTFIFKYKRYSTIIITGIILIGVMFYKGKGELGKSIYVYICGCIPCSDAALQEIEVNENLNGFITLNGIIRVITLIPNQLHLTNETEKKLEDAFKFRQKFEEAVMIGNGIQYNAYISMFSDYFMDFGISGVIIFSLLFGIGSTYTYNFAMKRPSYQSYGYLLFDVLLIWSSLIRIDIMMVYNVMTIIYISYLFPLNNIETDSIRSKISSKSINLSASNLANLENKSYKFNV